MQRSSLLVLCFFLASCSPHAEEKSAVVRAEEAAAPVISPGDSTVTYSYTVYSNDTVEGGPSEGFGYRLIRDGKPVIDQPQIPAVTGLVPFATMHDAEATASLAISKMQQGIFPPSISIAELDSIGIRH